jgi:hypothetical protein
VNRDEWAALARGIVTVLAGAVLVGAIGLFVSWWAVGAIAVIGVAVAAVDACRCPWWRLW